MEVIYSDSDIIVINKPPGISVHGPDARVFRDKARHRRALESETPVSGDSVMGATVVDFLLERFPEMAGVGEDPVRPGIVHRLDRDTSGVMVAARTQESFLALKGLFQARAVKKTYRAIVCGTPRFHTGTIDFPIGRMASNPTKRGVMSQTKFRSDSDLNLVWDSVKPGIRGAREAITEYRVLKSGGGYSLVELRPKTGRMHQLRVHMAAMGHPIACDKKYGGKNVCCPVGASAAGALPPRQLLHAQSLSFSLVPGRAQSFEADPPEDFIRAIGQIL